MKAQRRKRLARGEAKGGLLRLRVPMAKWAFFLAAAVFLCALAYYPGQIPFLPTQRGDSELILQMMQFSAETQGSYAATAIIYRYIDAVMDIRLFLCIFGVLAIFVSVKGADRVGDLTVLALCITFAIMLELSLSSKDVFVSGMSLSVLLITGFRRSSIYIRLGLIGLIYVIYGATVRSYYYLIILLAFIFLYSRIIYPQLRLPVLSILLLVVVFIAKDQLVAAQQTRDYVNDLRAAYLVGEGSRTAFYNARWGTDLVSFAVNYAYAAARLVWPIFWHNSVKDILFFIFSQSVVLTAFVLLRRRDFESRLIGSLLAAQMAGLWVFEPDLGSYARHLSSVFPYTAALWMFRSEDRAAASQRPPAAATERRPTAGAQPGSPARPFAAAHPRLVRSPPQPRPPGL